MVLNSFLFVVYFCVVYISALLVSGVIKKEPIRRRVFSWLLICASFVFVGFTDWRFAICLMVVSLIAYLVPMLALKSHNMNKRFWTRQGIIACILILGVFKYYNFFTESITSISGMDSTIINFILPLGISFYIFSAIGYMVDVYRNKYEVNDNFAEVMLYMSFFPKLSSGPIARADKFFDEIRQWNGIRSDDFQAGIQMFVVGMFKKMVIADHLGVFVNDVFFAPTAYNSLTVVWACISYSLQIYFDFSGYSDMAIGVARMLGIHLDRNFNFPYSSSNLTEFWKRWHISLSSWLQEYLYYSLGGNRKGTIRTYVNLILTMVIGGLWHGANWTFVFWGVLHGIGLVIHKVFVKWKKSQGIVDDNLFWRICSIIVTFSYATFCWIFFRAENFTNAYAVIRQMIGYKVGINQPYTWTIFAIVVLCILTFVSYRKKITLKEISVDYPIFNLTTIKGLTLFFVLFGLTLGMGYFGNTAFIYGAF